MKINYKLRMDAELEKIKESGEKPSLLLHACCAPCSTAVIEKLKDFFEITLFYHNPNISPEKEFLFRLEELKNLPKAMELEKIEVVAPEYNSGEFDAIAKGLEDVPEGGLRCEKCYRLRLEKTAEYAESKGFDYFTTTLSVSPYKNAAWLNEIGLELAEEYGVKYLCSDFKKENGYKRSVELSAKFGLYRQDYCGCEYSKRD